MCSSIKDGLLAFVGYLDGDKTPVLKDPIVVHGEKDDVVLDAVFTWNDTYYENLHAFTNNIAQPDGGTHVAGFRAALTRQINHYVAANQLIKREKVGLDGSDMREGLDGRVIC